MNIVKEIDKNVKNTKKYKKILITITCIISIIVCSFCIYLGVYNNTKTKLETHFNNGIATNNFIKNKEGYFELKDNEITFSVANQKMPKPLNFDLHFYNSNLDCEIKLNDEQIISITWLEYDYFYITLYNEKDDIIEYNFDKLHYNDLSNNISAKLNYNINDLKNIIKKGNKLYKDLYK